MAITDVTARVNLDADPAIGGLKKLDQTADEASKSVADGAKQADEALKDLAASEKRAGDAAESAGNRAEVSTEKLRHEVEMAENAFGDMRQSAERAADAVDDIGDRARKTGSDVDRMGNSFSELDGVLDLIKESAQIAFESLQAMSENGNPAAQRLMSSLEKIQQALLQIGENTRAQQNMENMANVIDDGVVPALRSAGDAAVYVYDKFNQWNAIGATALLQVIGAVEKGTLSTLWADQKRAELAVKITADKKEEAAATTKAAEASTKQLDVEKELESIARSRLLAEKQGELSKVKSVESLRSYVAEMESLARDESKSLEDRRAALANLAAAESRILELKRQQLDPAAELKKIEDEAAAAKRARDIQALQTIAQVEAHAETMKAFLADEKNGDEAKRVALDDLRRLEQRRVELTEDRLEQERKDTKELERQKREIERINALDREGNKTRAEATRILAENQKLLAAGVKDQERANLLLREMEEAKRRLLELDKQDAEAQRDAAQAANDRAAEELARRQKFAETKEGQLLGMMAADPKAVAERIAKDSGRKVGTVQGMMRRGDISETELLIAAKKNFEELSRKYQFQGDQMKLLFQGQSATIGSVINRADIQEQMIGQLQQQQNAMLGAARAREENTRRRRNGR